MFPREADPLVHRRRIRRGGGGDALATDFLVSNPGIAVCHACLAFAIEVGLGDVRAFVQFVRTFREFEQREDGVCVVCTRSTTTIAAVPPPAGSTPRLTRTIGYRNWRIDLVSHPTDDGWRPFALAKGPLPLGIKSPPPPSILPYLCVSRDEADERALTAVMGWIDALGADVTAETDLTAPSAPPKLTPDERVVLTRYCSGHVVAVCSRCHAAVRMATLGADLIAGRRDLCPSCGHDLAPALHDHIATCHDLDLEALERRGAHTHAQVVATVKKARALRDAARLRQAEAEAAHGRSREPQRSKASKTPEPS